MFNNITIHTHNSNRGRKTGFPNYKNDIVLNVIGDILPIGMEAWKIVADRYKTASGEVKLREYGDVKRHFYENLCDKGRKPTGSAAPKPESQKALEIYRRILQRENAAAIGADEQESEDEGSEDDSEGSNEGNDTEFNSQELITSVSSQMYSCMQSTRAHGYGAPRKKVKSLVPFTSPLNGDSKSKNSSNRNEKRGTLAGAITSMVECMVVKADSSKGANEVWRS
jgi:hypothetical protein